ncbi:hypothetical protein C789_1568 [Microcystis aeruginosa FACHB-905 = DIANCHI905]|nr:hypothetical protein C789_1568 [Microcystis aeruginosa FACHB-905 = DIANCHI905]
MERQKLIFKRSKLMFQSLIGFKINWNHFESIDPFTKGGFNP